MLRETPEGINWCPAFFSKRFRTCYTPTLPPRPNPLPNPSTTSMYPFPPLHNQNTLNSSSFFYPSKRTILTTTTSHPPPPRKKKKNHILPGVFLKQDVLKRGPREG